MDRVISGMNNLRNRVNDLLSEVADVRQDVANVQAQVREVQNEAKEHTEVSRLSWHCCNDMNRRFILRIFNPPQRSCRLASRSS